MHKFKQALLTAALACAGTPAFAADASPHTLTGNVSLISDYRYRGVSQTFKEPAIQGGFDYSHASGLYAGTWASNVDSNFLNGANIEMDFYGGYNGKINDDLSYNVGGLYYYYPGQKSAVDINTFEVYAGATWKWLNVKYSHSTTEFFGIPDSEGSGYLEANVAYPLPGDVNLTLHYGHQKIDGLPAGADDDIADWKIGVTKEMVGLTFGLAYADTDTTANFTRPSDGKTKNLADSTVLVSVGKTF